MTYRTLLALPLSLLALLGVEGRARACQPPPPGIYFTIPQDGDTYPANAALFLNGVDISIEGMTVTLDGQPASFGSPPAAMPEIPGYLAVTIQPTPQEGQKVAVQGTFCPPPSYLCTMQTITFTAGPPINEAPPLMNVVSLDVYDYPDVPNDGHGCGIPGVIDHVADYWIYTQTAPPPSMRNSPRLYAIEVFRDASLNKLVLTRAGFVEGGDPQFLLRMGPSETAGYNLSEAFCFRAKSIDAAGQVTESSRVVCKPCRYRGESLPNPELEPWTDADIYPDGPCGMGTSSASSGSTDSSGGDTDASSRDDVEFGGCGCRVGGSGATSMAAAWLAALPLAVGLRRRARRRSAKKQ